MPLYDTLGEAAVLHALDHADVRLAMPSSWQLLTACGCLIAVGVCFLVALGEDLILSKGSKSVSATACSVCGETNAEQRALPCSLAAKVRWYA